MATTRRTKAKAKAGETKAQEAAPIIAVKGFGPDWTCRGFKFEVGKTYKHDGPVEPCESGFHACLDPFDVLSYYGFDGKFAEVELAGETKPHTEDTKIAAAEITIKAELTIPAFIQRGVDFIMSKVDWKGASESNTGDESAATNTGDLSAATNTGNRSAAT
ncbi:MAG: hypothetical protein Q8P46_00170, partial [Hyphomicrobiales bacterium]|nr:hypothetical protein [Hyphomicrobiales bacterium]